MFYNQGEYILIASSGGIDVLPQGRVVAGRVEQATYRCDQWSGKFDYFLYLKFLRSVFHVAVDTHFVSVENVGSIPAWGTSHIAVDCVRTQQWNTSAQAPM